jgi:hypothetical protein
MKSLSDSIFFSYYMVIRLSCRVLLSFLDPEIFRNKQANRQRNNDKMFGKNWDRDINRADN